MLGYVNPLGRHIARLLLQQALAIEGPGDSLASDDSPVAGRKKATRANGRERTQPSTGSGNVGSENAPRGTPDGAPQ